MRIWSSGKAAAALSAFVLLLLLISCGGHHHHHHHHHHRDTSTPPSTAAEEGEVVWIRASATEPEPGILKDLRLAGARIASVGITEAEQRTREFGGGPVVVVAIGKAADEAIRIALSKDNHITRVVALNGIYELALVQRTNVDVLLFSDSEPAHARAARRVARSIGSKHAAHYVVTPSDSETMKKLAIEFLRTGESQTLSVDSPLGVQQRWANLDPPVPDAEAFWRAPHVDRATTQPTTGHFQVALTKIFSESMHLLAPYPLAKYTSIPLEAKGEHLIVTNIRGEQLYLTKQQIQLYQPVIVIGIDDEKNLYRLALGYRLDQERSWEKTPRPPTMVRAVGPFLFFPNGPPPAELEDTTQAAFSLSPGSFQLVSEDPIAKARAIRSNDLRAALLGADGCLKCHGLHGMGAKAHHVRAIDGKAHGGFALALESYPHDVLDRFLFDQKTVAKGFGVTPLTIPEPTAKQLLAYVRTAKE